MVAVFFVILIAVHGIVSDIIDGDDEVKYEQLPKAQEWKDAPSCPLWGPMETFYKEGVEKGRVSLSSQ